MKLKVLLETDYLFIFAFANRLTNQLTWLKGGTGSLEKQTKCRNIAIHPKRKECETRSKLYHILDVKS
jgi:hypothetical protein